MVKVSVIVPVYNVELYLSKCLDSVLTQTLHDIEVICINDGSTDGSGKILEDYAKSDNRIKVMTKNNEGLSAARNDGVRLANGQYLFFLDSDDYIESNTLERLFDEAEKNNLEIATYGIRAFCDANKLEQEESLKLQKLTDSINNWLTRDEIRNNVIVGGQEFLSESFQAKHYLSMAVLLFINREFYITKGFNFLTGIIHEDEVFSLTALIQTKKMKFLNCVFYNYRIRPKSIMTNLDMYKSVKSLFTILSEIF